MKAYAQTIPEPTVITPGIYRHFKGGLYQVLGLTRHSETNEPFVVYQQLGENETWIRPYGMFVETVSRGGVCKPRFVKVADTAEQIEQGGARCR